MLLLALLAAGPAAWAAVTGSGTQNDPYVVDNWADLKAKMAAGGYIRLGANVTGDSYLEVPAGVSVTLDLNGKALQRTVQAGNVSDETGYVIKVTTSNSTLTITDNSTGGTGTISGGNADKGGAFYVDAGSTLIINGGVIANCQANFGSAIYNLGTLTINGGTIQNCTATSGLGQGTIYNNGTLTINGGVIQNNTAFYGGAIYNVYGWTTTINGGTIQNNSAIHAYYDDDGIGGGIANYGVLYLYGGTIQGNSCDREGGGIWMTNDGSLFIKGNPVIRDNRIGSDANNVYVPNEHKVINVVGDLTEAARIGVSPENTEYRITNGLPGRGTKANFVSDYDGFALKINDDGELTMDKAYKITVPENVTVIGLTPTAANTYQEVSGNVVTLSATGYVITSASYNDGSDHVIDPVQGVFSFTMPSCDVTVSAVLKANKWSALQTRLTNASTNANSPTLITLTEDIVASDGDSYLSIPAGHHAIIDLNGHKIDRNMTESLQGGYVLKLDGASNNHATLVIRDTQGGGQITGGFDGTAGGGSAAGGINVQYGDLTLEGGSICGNKCTFGGGGGVRVAGGTFTMTGGSITGNVVNTLKGAASAGGAIYGYIGDIYLRGGSITDNTTYGSSYACGGIAHDYASSAAQLHLSGTFTLSDNRKLSYDTNTHDWTTVVGSDYLHGNREYIILDGPISPTAPIAIDLYSGYNKRLTTNWDTHMGTADPGDCFTLVPNSESSGKAIGVKDGNLYIGTPEEFYWHADANHDGSSEEKAYIITTTEGLDLLATYVNSGNSTKDMFFKLGADIAYNPNDLDANGENYTAIGGNFLINSNTWYASKFQGTFDGDGHTISGIRISKNGNTPADSHQALFGGVGKNGAVKNVILTDAIIIGSGTVGAFFAYINGTFANNYYYNCTVNGKTANIGTGNGDVIENDGAVPVPAASGLTLVQGTKDGITAWWGTYYHSALRYTLPEGAAAYTMDKDHHLYRLGTDGRTIPAGVAVVIISNKQDITLTLDTGSATVADHSGGNILRGGPATLTDGKVDGKTPYVLGVVEDVLGFYRYDGSSIPAQKAYLVE